MIRHLLPLALLLALPALAQQSAETTQIGTASIEGTVFDAVSSAPVKKAEVTLIGAVRSAQAPLTATTDASGEFAFRKLPPGNWTVEATHPAFDMQRSAILGDSEKQIELVDGQQATGVTLRLTPYGNISGRLTDEWGEATSGCQVIAIPAGRRARASTATYGANSDDRGEYRIPEVRAGRYSVYERCASAAAADHGFLERGDVRTPELVFLPEFYGGTPSLNGASVIAVAPGAEVQGIDFRLKTVTAVTLRIAVSSDRRFDPRDLAVRLDPVDSDFTHYAAAYDRNSGSWLARRLIPGAYTVRVSSSNEDENLFGETDASVREGDAKPVIVQVSPPMVVTGMVQSDGDAKSQRTPVREIALISLDDNHDLPAIRSRINRDGTFFLSGVVPGRWMLRVEGIPGFIRSATLGQREISPASFEIAPGGSGPLNLVISSKQIPVAVAISGADSAQQLWVIAIPASGDETSFAGGGQGIVANHVQGGSAQLKMAPGKYSLYAIDCTQVSPLIHDVDLWSAIADRGKPLEVRDGETGATVSLDLIRRDDLRSALQRGSQ